MKDDRVYLLHIRDAVQRILDYTRDGQDFFLADTKTQDAVIRNIEIIGEAAKNLSDALKGGHVDIPWKQIAGMRDTLIHRYFGVKLALVWEVVEKDLPGFIIRVHELLKATEPPTPTADNSESRP
jgi:uncharacterized protein with HEPN domain